MNLMRWKNAVIAVFALLVLAGIIAIAGGRSAAAIAPTKSIEIRWLIAHEPASVFARAEKKFADTLAAKSGGRITLKVLTPPDVGFAHDVPAPEVHKLMDSGDIDIATVPTASLAGVDLTQWVFNLPFLFTDYASTEKVLDGPVGAELLSRIGKNTNAEGLAFSFSGGFEIIPTRNKKIEQPSDLKGLKIATPHGPVALEVLRALGATPVDTPLQELSQTLSSGNADGIETTYTRMDSWFTPDIKYVNETDHAVFLTVLLANQSFYSSLSAGDQKIVRDAALAAMQTEREDSIALAQTNRAILKAAGVTITTLSPDERNAFVQATQPVYTRLTPQFGASLIESIRQGQL